MSKHFTFMIIPDNATSTKSIRIPSLLFKSLALIFTCVLLVTSIMLYDYWKIHQSIHENKHLSLENRQLRDQIQLFQMKLNSLTSDLERINTFEKKLRVITGLESEIDLTKPASNKYKSQHMMEEAGAKDIDESEIKDPKQSYLDINSLNLDFSNMKQDSEFLEIKKLYSNKVAANLGLSGNYDISQRFSDLIKNSFTLADRYTEFTYKYNKIKDSVESLESKINEIDQHLLDKESLLRSTPTILPSPGWITSYFGHRISPYAKVLKMHEGLDIGAPYGTPIIAPADGIVVFSGTKAGFGNFIQIDHGYGIETLYAHSQKLVAKKGEKVTRGQLIAKVGSTGYSTGPHLHYEVRINGIAVDPMYYVLGR